MLGDGGRGDSPCLPRKAACLGEIGKNRLLFPVNVDQRVQGEPILSEGEQQRALQPPPKEASPFAGLLALSLAVHAVLIFALIFLKPLSMTGTGGAESEISVEIVSEDGQEPGQGAPGGEAGSSNGAAKDDAGSQPITKSTARGEGTNAKAAAPSAIDTTADPKAPDVKPENLAKTAESKAADTADAEALGATGKPPTPASHAGNPDSNDLRGPVQPPPEPKQAKIADHQSKPTQRDPAEKTDQPIGTPAKTLGKKGQRNASEASESARTKPTQHDGIEQPKTGGKSKDDKWDVAMSLPFFLAPEVMTPAEAPLSGQGDNNDADYKGVVYGKLEHAKIYPETARARRAQGQVIVAFSIGDDGQVQNLKLVQSSGEADLDAEALAMVQRVSPFPPPKPDAQRFFQPAIIFGLDD